MTVKKAAPTRQSNAALSLAAFAETGKPANPFQRALLRAWERIQDVITEEFITVLNEETAAAYNSGYHDGLKEKRERRPGGAPSNNDLRRIYRTRR